MQNHQELEAWINPYLLGVTKQIIGKGITLDREHGAIVEDGVTDEDIGRAINRLLVIKQKNSIIQSMVDRFVGQLILHYSAVHNTDWTSAISQLNLCEHTGKAYRSLMKLPRIVSELPDEAFMLPGVATQHLDAATSFRPPSDPDVRRQFNARRMDILRKVSEDPHEFNKAFVTEAMRELQAEFGVAPSRRPPADVVKMNIILSVLMLIDFAPEDYETFGITKEETLARLSEYREQAVDRDIIPETLTDPLKFCPPWRVKPIIDISHEHIETTEIPAGEEDSQSADGHRATELQGPDSEGVHAPETGGSSEGQDECEAPWSEETEASADRVPCDSGRPELQPEPSTGEDQ